jgi:hypothetical protein
MASHTERRLWGPSVQFVLQIISSLTVAPGSSAPLPALDKMRSEGSGPPPRLSATRGFAFSTGYGVKHLGIGAVRTVLWQWSILSLGCAEARYEIARSEGFPDEYLATLTKKR